MAVKHTLPQFSDENIIKAYRAVKDNENFTIKSTDGIDLLTLLRIRNRLGIENSDMICTNWLQQQVTRLRKRSLLKPPEEEKVS